MPNSTRPGRPGSIRARADARIARIGRIIAAIALSACACMGASVTSAAASTQPTTSPPHESVAVFEGQLRGGQVRVATLHTKTHSFHVLLKDGRKTVVVFPAARKQELLGQARAKGVTVKMAKAQQPPSHTRRWIAVGVALAVLIALVAGAWWFFVRRRRMREEELGPGAR
jgi:ATP-dependent Zn protease